MNNRTHNIILRLIKNERRKRNTYVNAFNRIQSDFSQASIQQMKAILEGKRTMMTYGEHMTINKVIHDFEMYTKKFNQ